MIVQTTSGNVWVVFSKPLISVVRRVVGLDECRSLSCQGVVALGVILAIVICTLQHRRGHLHIVISGLCEFAVRYLLLLFRNDKSGFL